MYGFDYTIGWYVPEDQNPSVVLNNIALETEKEIQFGNYPEKFVLNDDIPDSLSGTLWDENNANIGSVEEATQRGVDLLVRSVTLDDHEVLHTTVIAFTHTRKKETSDSWCVTNGGD